MMDEPEVKELWTKVQADSKAWRECSRHSFDPLPGGYQLGAKLRCKSCGVERRLSDIGEYIRGYQAAGGDPTDILPDWR